MADWIPERGRPPGELNLGRGQWSQPTGDLVGPADTLHSILRTVCSRERDFNQGDDKVRLGFRTFWIGRGLSCEFARARDCARARVCQVGRAGSERASWRRWPLQHRRLRSSSSRPCR